MVNVLIVNYNTQELTAAAIRSLWKHHPDARVTVFDNSDAFPFVPDRQNKIVNCKLSNGKLEVIDNTQGQLIDWDQWLEQFPEKMNNTQNNWGSAKHCYTVDYCLDRFPDGFLLMDSDILLTRDVSDLCDPSQAFVGETAPDPCRSHFSVLRVLPMLCWINTPMLSQYGIRYFHPDKMWMLNGRKPDKWYDTGAWLLEAVKSSHLPYRTICLDDYILHYGNGSWRQRIDPCYWLEQHRELWENSK